MQRDVVEAQKGNGQLQVSSRIHNNYDMFISLYPQIGFKQAVYTSLKKDLNRIKFNNLKNLVKHLIKK